MGLVSDNSRHGGSAINVPTQQIHPTQIAGSNASHRITA